MRWVVVGVVVGVVAGVIVGVVVPTTTPATTQTTTHHMNDSPHKRGRVLGVFAVWLCIFRTL